MPGFAEGARRAKLRDADGREGTGTDGAQVEDGMASLVVAQLLFLESENPEKPIFMYINSPGGLITAGMAIYDTMQVGGRGGGGGGGGGAC